MWLVSYPRAKDYADSEDIVEMNLRLGETLPEKTTRYDLAWLQALLWRIREEAPKEDAFSRPVEGPCWIYTGRLSSDGYARQSYRQHLRSAARTLLKILGRIEAEQTTDHLCRSRACVNPKHLEAVSNLENIARGSVGPLMKAECPVCGNARRRLPKLRKNGFYWFCDRCNSEKGKARYAAKRASQGKRYRRKRPDD